MAEYVSQRFDVIGKKFPEAFFERSRAFLGRMLVRTANINEQCKSVVDKLSTSKPDCRPVLGKRKRLPAQFSRLSKELVNAKSLEQHMKDMEDRLLSMETNRDVLFKITLEVSPEEWDN